VYVRKYVSDGPDEATASGYIICQVDASVTVRSEPRGGVVCVLQYCPGIYIDISLSKDISF
jgi:hypothetical protein